MNAKQIYENNYFNFIFFCVCGEQFLFKNDQLFIIKKTKKEIIHFPEIQQIY